MKARTTRHVRALYDTYTRDVSSEDLQRLFTHDTWDAYRFYARGSNADAVARLPWWRRLPERIRYVFVAFTLKLPPARRILYLAALVIAFAGIIQANGTYALVLSFLLLNFLVLLEVAERLSLKGELEVARDIQLAMLPAGTYRA